MPPDTRCLWLCRTKQLYIFVLGNLKHQYQYFCRFCMPKITLQDICKQNIQLVWESITESNFIGQTFVQTLIFSLGSALTPSHSLKYRLAEINRVPWILHRYFHGNLLQHLSYPYIDNFLESCYESYFDCTSTILDKHDKFITGFEHSCSLQEAEAVVKATLQALFH